MIQVFSPTGKLRHLRWQVEVGDVVVVDEEIKHEVEQVWMSGVWARAELLGWGLLGMGPMSCESIFDAVSEHLLAQGKAGRELDYGPDTCAYRGDRGTKCAVGFCIADEHYDRRLEGTLLHDQEVRMALYRSGVISAEESEMKLGVFGFSTEKLPRRLKLLRRLQAAHDDHARCEGLEWARRVGEALATIKCQLVAAP